MSVTLIVFFTISASGIPANASNRDYVKAWGKFATQTYSGVGDDVINLPRAITARIIKGSHSGSSNFAVEALDRNGNYNDLVFNEIGVFSGVNTIGMSSGDAPSKFLEVTADGSWTIEIRSLEKAPRFTRAGTGQAVIKYSSGFKIWQIRHSGRSNFAIWQYCSNGNSDLLVNEIGNYSGRKTLLSGSCVLVIEADGNWSIRR